MIQIPFNAGRNAGEASVLEWQTRLFSSLESTKLVYRQDAQGQDDLHGHLVFIGDGGPVRVLTTEDFKRLAHRFLNITRPRFNAANQTWDDVPAYLSQNEASIALGSPAIGLLPEVRFVTAFPMVTFETGEPAVTLPGYNPSSKIYYFVKPGDPPIVPVPGTEHLTTCFSGLPFEATGHRNNLIAWLLGAITFDDSITSPFLVATGNQQNIGKSSAVQAVGIILSGKKPLPIAFGGDEFTKQLGSRFMDGERLAFLDNITSSGNHSYDNPDLAKCLTQGFSQKIRILGVSRSISASGILFAGSVNNAKMSTDIATRSLPVRLYLERPRVMKPYCVDFALEHRHALYGELLWLATQAPRSTEPGPETSTFRFRGWLDFVYPRIIKNLGGLAISDQAQLDEAAIDLAAYGSVLLGDNKETETFTAQHFIASLESSSEQYPAIKEKLIAKIASNRGRQTAAGRLFKNVAEQEISPYPGTVVVLTLAGKNELGCSLYKFRLVTERA